MVERGRRPRQESALATPLNCVSSEASPKERCPSAASCQPGSFFDVVCLFVVVFARSGHFAYLITKPLLTHPKLVITI